MIAHRLPNVKPDQTWILSARKSMPSRTNQTSVGVSGSPEAGARGRHSSEVALIRKRVAAEKLKADGRRLKTDG
jgi:hypothetical protein